MNDYIYIIIRAHTCARVGGVCFYPCTYYVCHACNMCKYIRN